MAIEPVTTSGWYECEDGKVREYTWVNGQLVEGETADDWGHVARIKEARRIDDEAYVPRHSR